MILAARRNLTPEQQSYLRGKRYNREKGDSHRPEKRHQNGDVKPKGRTKDRLAKELKVGTTTIERDGKFTAAVDKLAETHGMRRTNADKRRSVMTLLEDAEWSAKGNAWVARQTGVDDKTVAKYRSEMEVSSEIPKIETRQVTRNGKTCTPSAIADKRQAVTICLDALGKAGDKWSENKVGKHCGASHNLVAEVRAERGEKAKRLQL